MKLLDPKSVERIAILGAGTIGASWAAQFLSSGFSINIWDPAPGFENRCLSFIKNAWPMVQKLGVGKDLNTDKINFFDDPVDAISNCHFIQESGPEDKATKISLFSKLDENMPDDIILASSSSGLLISELQTGFGGGARYVIGHPFNPPHLIPLVEVVGGKKTDPAAVDWAINFYNGCGKRAIRINKEVPGHLANRLQAAMWREAAHLVAQDVASVEDVDAAICYGPGLRWALMGPNLILHLAGGRGGIRHSIEHLGPALETWWADLGSAPSLSTEACEKLINGVEQEADGRSINQLAEERDKMLVSLLEMLSRERKRN